ncbi:MAG: nitrile hydratase subunit beta, partial [Chloroflexi bacterium]|nr:nitrile hydratase subunit beta [Chloroflexota bacterium]
PDADAEYYQLWLASLEHLLVEKGLVSPEELEARTAEFAMGTWDDH